MSHPRARGAFVATTRQAMRAESESRCRLRAMRASEESFDQRGFRLLRADAPAPTSSRMAAGEGHLFSTPDCARRCGQQRNEARGLMQASSWRRSARSGALQPQCGQ